MTAREAIAYIENHTWSSTRLGLGRTRALLHAMGDPQERLRFVHVAGSNGKGSTSAMLDAILRAAGYRVGLYTSPYIEDFCERIRVDGQNIPGDALAAITERAASTADGMDDHPSQFELVTAIAMEYFLAERCDIVVLEVGMGGALDSTNVIGAPEAAVITNIGLEHTEYLGSTLGEIARTKAGIIKPGCRAVLYDGAPEVTAVIAELCAARGVPLRMADFAAITPLTCTLDGQRFSYRGEEYELALLGRHQLRNAAVVLETVGVLRERGLRIGDTAVRAGLRGVTWPARLELLSRAPLFILDGGHNPQCADALAESLGALLPGQRAVFLTGVLADKDWPAIMARLMPLARQFICLTPENPRALDAEKLAAYLTEHGAPARVSDDIPAGIRAALDAAGEDGIVVAFGSLYLAGAVRSAFPNALRAWLRTRKIQAREGIAPKERAAASEAAVQRILRSAEFRRARTVMLYRAVRAELSLETLPDAPEAAGKRLVFPRCMPGGELAAFLPGAWKPGPFGIEEPDPDASERVEPAEIDLVVCPCAAFDGRGARLGMGGGYYDRFLPQCENAVAAAAAFEAQRAEHIPSMPWDAPVDVVFTEADEYRTEK